MSLYNKVNREILKKAMEESEEQRVTLSFYKYFKIENPHIFRDELFQQWEQFGVCGRVYVSSEGINAQISLPQEHFESFKDCLENVDGLKGVRLNIAIDDDGKSFYKLKIKVRDKIVADGLEEGEIDFSNGGKHIDAVEFNELTDQENTVIVDMRNHYESEVGHFEGAICPDVDTFRDSLPIVNEILEPHKDKNIVMYCTGGIRCEKASAYLKQKGFENVFQLDGGIINYARQIKSLDLPNKFRGKNFVFDERLGERISDEVISHCHQCGKPCDTHVNCKNVTCNLLFIQCEDCAKKYSGCCSYNCRDFIQLPKGEQKKLRSGVDKGIRIYSKGRYKAPRLSNGPTL